MRVEPDRPSGIDDVQGPEGRLTPVNRTGSVARGCELMQESLLSFPWNGR
jgi:hypothetical protein